MVLARVALISKKSSDRLGLNVTTAYGYHDVTIGRPRIRGFNYCETKTSAAVLLMTLGGWNLARGIMIPIGSCDSDDLFEIRDTLVLVVLIKHGLVFMGSSLPTNAIIYGANFCHFLLFWQLQWGCEAAEAEAEDNREWFNKMWGFFSRFTYSSLKPILKRLLIQNLRLMRSMLRLLRMKKGWCCWPPRWFIVKKTVGKDTIAQYGLRASNEHLR